MKPAHRIRARRPRGELRAPASLASSDEVAVYLHDAAHTPGGHTPRVLLARSEGEVAWALREAPALLPIGAQSSLTGGATPFGEWVLSTARMDAIGPVRGDRVRAQAGVALSSLADALRPHGLFFPPTPTYAGAFVGGAVATNAAGAATFKYGSTRHFVEALGLVLANGDVLDLERGEARASPEGWFEIELASGEVRRVPAPGYTMPDVPKRSAGYHSEPGLDLVDLLVGSEGTLGVVTEVELRLLPEPPRLVGWATLGSEAQALALVAALREASRATWASGDPLGVDVSAIESVDRRCLALLREEGKDRESGLFLDAGADTAVLLEIELAAGADAASALDQLEAEADSPLRRLVRLLERHGAADALVVALPGDTRRAAQLKALREGVPILLNQRVEAAQRDLDPLVRKVAADMIVPFQRLGEAMPLYREAFSRRGLDCALWGHASDGNIHANVLPRSGEDVRLGDEAILELGRAVIRMGGCPMSEHGVGRNAVKQELLLHLYGEAGLEAMRRVKQALDPAWKLAPGVLFPR